jgi:hypothetical protein
LLSSIISFFLERKVGFLMDEFTAANNDLPDGFCPKPLSLKLKTVVVYPGMYCT